MPAIEGTISKEGAGLGGAYVRLIGPSGEFVAEIYTGDDGAFRFHVAEGTWRIEARAAGLEKIEREVSVGASDETVALEA